MAKIIISPKLRFIFFKNQQIYQFIFGIMNINCALCDIKLWYNITNDNMADRPYKQCNTITVQFQMSRRAVYRGESRIAGCFGIQEDPTPVRDAAVSLEYEQF